MKAQLFTLLAAAAVGTGTVQARGEYAEIARLRSMNETVRGIRSMADGEHYTTLESNDIVRYSYASAAPGESMLPAPAPNLVITDYAFSPAERMICSGRPILRAISIANELPGLPVSRRKRGFICCTSKSIAPLAIPSVPDAKYLMLA